METSTNFRINLLNTNKKWIILKKLYENINNKKEKKIPKILHQIWLGGPIPNGYLPLIEKWKNNHPDWEFRLWGDEDIKEFDLDKDEIYNKISNLGSKSDVLRYHIVNKYGGVYTDTDFVSLKSFNPLINYNFFSGGFSILDHQNGDPEIYNGLFGSVPNHPILHQCIKNVYSSLNQSSILESTGPRFFTDMIFKIINGEEKDVVFLPLSYFYPFPGRLRHGPKNINKWVKPETLCVHLWNTSWQ
jgi:mannosyltransferase OCH1-like enzyme